MNSKSRLEEHLITSLVMLIVAMVSWVGFTVVQSSKDIASLQRDSEFMREDISEMKEKVANMEEILISRHYAMADY